MSDSMSPPLNSDNTEETKKRTRVTPAQLTILEETFSMTATPDSKVRKQLAEKLKMPERSIQIWFQNRRAKVKLLQKRVQQEQISRTSPYWHSKQKMPMHRAWSSDMMQSPLSHTPSLPPPPNHIFPFQRDSSSLSIVGPAYYTPSPQPSLLKGLENEDLSVGHITASSLTIGTWHRMKINQLDLQCFYSIIDRQFSWHIRDSAYHFKMIVSFDSISSIELHLLNDNLSAQINVQLLDLPIFFMENNHCWIQCSDFTEGMQASCVLNHLVRGLAIDLQQQLLTITSVDDRLSQVTRFPTMSYH
ncbi:homeobox domain-containing protein [Sporodiniella umbellata]|nr:homeobox domain-containing protein [Sporodiniella umbellata]